MTNPKDNSQYQIDPRTTPRVRAEARRVIVRLELISLVDHNDRRDVELVLEADIALTLGKELELAAKKIGQ